MNTARTLAVRAAALTLAALFLAGCNAVPKRDPEFAATLPVPMPQPAQQYSGAIYQAGYDMVLFEDIKARRVGDVLTIRLVERTNASKQAESSTDKSTSNNVSNPTVFGASPQFSVPGFLPLDNTTDLSLETNLASNHAFKGGGDSTQSNSLSGDITVTVAEVLPNGYLVVRGEKRMNLNQGNEYVKISGIVRPVDIATDNTVVSTRVADASIVYAGDGQVADANKQGWLSRFFSSALMPF